MSASEVTLATGRPARPVTPIGIAAEELELSPACFDMLSGDTDDAPEEGFTVGSLSVEVSGSAIRAVAAEVLDPDNGRAVRRANRRPDVMAFRT